MAQKKIKTDIPDDLRAPLLAAALNHVPFEGWQDKVLEEAAQDLDLAPGLAQLAFPGGARDMIDFMAARHDRLLSDQVAAMDLDAMKIRDRIRTLVKTRLMCEAEHRESTRRGVTWLALPQHQALGARLLYRSVDLMWKLADDTATDFNYYTKRLTLAGVYSSTLLYWLNDESEDYADTWGFLDRRIDGVMKIEKAKARFRDAKAKLPDFWKLAGKLRHHRTTRHNS